MRGRARRSARAAKKHDGRRSVPTAPQAHYGLGRSTRYADVPAENPVRYHAYERFHSFPPDDVDYIEGWSRKRDGDSQMILLHLATEAHMQDFLALCRQEGSIVDVTPITE